MTSISYGLRPSGSFSRTARSTPLNGSRRSMHCPVELRRRVLQHGQRDRLAEVVLQRRQPLQGQAQVVPVEPGPHQLVLVDEQLAVRIEPVGKLQRVALDGGEGVAPVADRLAGPLGK